MTLKADQSLSDRVRSGTRADHDAAQGSGFLDALADGRLPLPAYTDLAAQHYAIYETLERAAVTMGGDTAAGAFVFPELVRLPALAADLRFLGGSPFVLPATDAYCARLREVAFDRPAAFVAHHYTRYLGDLSGGQYLGPAIARAYGLDGAGHQFFVFPGVHPPAFRARYRDLLDRVQWSSGEQDAFLAEVSEAYRLNIAVLAELKEKWGMTFEPEVVAQIAKHMNDDHAEGMVLIVRGLGGMHAATAARVSGVDADGMEFAAAVNDVEVPVRIPFSERVTERGQIRAETVRMYREACAVLGVEPDH
jgi:heme oxygenase